MYSVLKIADTAPSKCLASLLMILLAFILKGNYRCFSREFSCLFHAVLNNNHREAAEQTVRTYRLKSLYVVVCFLVCVQLFYSLKYYFGAILRQLRSILSYLLCENTKVWVGSEDLALTNGKGAQFHRCDRVIQCNVWWHRNCVILINLACAVAMTMWLNAGLIFYAQCNVKQYVWISTYLILHNSDQRYAEVSHVHQPVRE